VKPKWRLIWLVGLLVLWLVCTGATPFQPLAYRLEQYPQWNTKPPVEAAQGDLDYPSWFEGKWQVETTLVEMTAPLAPEVETPGFESNRDFLDRPVTFQARFSRQAPMGKRIFLGNGVPFIRPFQGSSKSAQVSPIFADHAFNGLNLARAYLNDAEPGMGDRLVLNVKVDPQNPNRQVTVMKGDRQLISTVTGRRVESGDSNRFITTEVFQQVFRGIAQPYLNEVETTTDYRYAPENLIPITADQITAVYLSPKDPDYFKAGDRPVALYRYRLAFHPQRSEAAVNKDL
jgi:hypothetical protein